MSSSIYHYTYLITNTNTQMKYIGVRSCSCLPENDLDYMGSSKILSEAMQETPESFVKTILGTFLTREVANKDEQRLHEMYDVARNPKFYNRMNAPLGFCSAGKTGKDSYWYGKHRSSETKQKLREAMSGENNPNYGGKRSDATKRKISESQRGKNNPFFGKKHSPESKKKMSKIQKGRIHSPETKKKIGESNKGKSHERITCPHCNKTGGNNNMKRWHFTNCKEISTIF